MKYTSISPETYFLFVLEKIKIVFLRKIKKHYPEIIVKYTSISPETYFLFVLEKIKIVFLRKINPNIKQVFQVRKSVTNVTLLDDNGTLAM